jgi:catechol 2,3-dioxygenase-like lactoylglutathione lyase family enzyme
MLDEGLTHVAFVVGDIEASIRFYTEYAHMRVVHDRADASTGSRVAWVTDGTRPFVLVLIGLPPSIPGRRWLSRKVARLVPAFSHLGVGCRSRDEVDALCERAKRAGILRRAPADLGPPVGYFGLISDPDGNTLEVAFGQEVGLAVEQSAG